MTMDLRSVMSIATLAILIIMCIVYFIKLPKEDKVKNVKEWLKWAVVEAGKALGSGTGQLKFRMVYDMAIKQFPWLIVSVSFDIFSQWVDEALVWMKEQLETNEKVKDYTLG